MQAEIITLSKVIRKELPSANEDAHLDGFCKALLILKMFLKSSGIEIVVGVNNLLAAELITAQEVRALAAFYGWDLPI
jgi:hypothetical protein